VVSNIVLYYYFVLGAWVSCGMAMVDYGSGCMALVEEGGYSSHFFAFVVTFIGGVIIGNMLPVGWVLAWFRAASSQG
jgi:hypothetical protein